ncbi:hypothetical protein HAX54_005366 [Datura stramonium]|uniref:Proline-rich protein n=1 Tax=Datura stramonium TaxID=4076 RepID=A0ABS8TA13_DATST|nr:hypothetical protein [Datura stramonium]
MGVVSVQALLLLLSVLVVTQLTHADEISSHATLHQRFKIGQLPPKGPPPLPVKSLPQSESPPPPFNSLPLPNNEQAPRPPDDGEKRPRPPDDGEKRPRPPDDDEQAPHPPDDGEKRPRPPDSELLPSPSPTA